VLDNLAVGWGLGFLVGFAEGVIDGKGVWVGVVLGVGVGVGVEVVSPVGGVGSSVRVVCNVRAIANTAELIRQTIERDTAARAYKSRSALFRRVQSETL
jgi:hypothetical protein